MRSQRQLLPPLPPGHHLVQLPLVCSPVPAPALAGPKCQQGCLAQPGEGEGGIRGEQMGPSLWQPNGAYTLTPHDTSRTQWATKCFASVHALSTEHAHSRAGWVRATPLPTSSAACLSQLASAAAPLPHAAASVAHAPESGDLGTDGGSEDATPREAVPGSADDAERNEGVEQDCV